MATVGWIRVRTEDIIKALVKQDADSCSCREEHPEELRFSWWFLKPGWEPPSYSWFITINGSYKGLFGGPQCLERNTHIGSPINYSLSALFWLGSGQGKYDKPRSLEHKLISRKSVDHDYVERLEANSSNPLIPVKAKYRLRFSPLLGDYN